MEDNYSDEQHNYYVLQVIDCRQLKNIQRKPKRKLLFCVSRCLPETRELFIKKQIESIVYAEHGIRMLDCPVGKTVMTYVMGGQPQKIAQEIQTVLIDHGISMEQKNDQSYRFIYDKTPIMSLDVHDMLIFKKTKLNKPHVKELAIKTPYEAISCDKL